MRPVWRAIAPAACKKRDPWSKPQHPTRWANQPAISPPQPTWGPVPRRIARARLMRAIGPSDQESQVLAGQAPLTSKPANQFTRTVDENRPVPAKARESWRSRPDWLALASAVGQASRAALAASKLLHGSLGSTRGSCPARGTCTLRSRPGPRYATRIGPGDWFTPLARIGRVGRHRRLPDQCGGPQAAVHRTSSPTHGLTHTVGSTKYGLTHTLSGPGVAHDRPINAKAIDLQAPAPPHPGRGETQFLVRHSQGKAGS